LCFPVGGIIPVTSIPYRMGSVLIASLVQWASLNDV